METTVKHHIHIMYYYLLFIIIIECMSIVCSSFCLTCCCLLITTATTIAGECTNRHAIRLNVCVCVFPCVWMGPYATAAVLFKRQNCKSVHRVENYPIESNWWRNVCSIFITCWPANEVNLWMKWQMYSEYTRIGSFFACYFNVIFHVKSIFIARSLSEFDWNIRLNDHNKSAL